MTEQEAGAFAERLARVWEPISEPTVESFIDEDSVGAWFFKAPLDHAFEIHVSTIESPVPFLRLDHRSVEGRPPTPIMCTGYDCQAGGVADVHIFDKEEGNPQIAEQWIKHFRQNCWLSGCPIEATAHEKAEWMQDFTKEELESWNLKI